MVLDLSFENYYIKSMSSLVDLENNGMEAYLMNDDKAFVVCNWSRVKIQKKNYNKQIWRKTDFFLNVNHSRCNGD